MYLDSPTFKDLPPFSPAFADASQSPTFVEIPPTPPGFQGQKRDRATFEPVLLNREQNSRKVRRLTTEQETDKVWREKGGEPAAFIGDMEKVAFQLIIFFERIAPGIEGSEAFLVSLESLSLSNKAAKIKEWMKSNRNLLTSVRKIDYFTGYIKKLPKEVSYLNQLTYLCLSNALQTLPNSIGKLENLKVLILNNNKLVSLPDSIGRLRNLEILYANQNRLDALPDSIGELENLQELDLSINNLSCLPDSLRNLKNLQRLDLAHNSLSTIGLGNLEKIQTLFPTIDCSLGRSSIFIFPGTKINLSAYIKDAY